LKEKIKKRVFEILEFSPREDRVGKAVDVFIITLIVLNICAVIIGTVESISAKYAAAFRIFEVFSIAVFTVEYILRVITCTSENRFKGAVKGRVKFVLTPLAVVDIFAILPFYLPMLFPFDLRIVRALRLYRIFVLFKMARYSSSLRIFGRVMRNKKEELLIAVSIITILIIISASLMYFVEHEVQPEVFSSIPATMYWAVETLTTVGYGDVVPVSILGKFLGSIISILGIGLFAMPAGILAAGFSEEIEKSRKKK